MTLHFTTIFDKNYLSRGLSLYHSLKKYNDNFVLYIIAVDDEVYKYFKSFNMPDIICYKLSELEDCYIELSELKSKRNQVSYLFTLSPFYPLFILKKNPDIPHICSLDADQFFFSNPSTIFDSLIDADILITPHRFSDKQIQDGLEIAGKYNVSFQIFKNNQVGRDCLELWREQCTNWCFDNYEDNKFADQKYLETWDLHFKDRVKAINHKGLGLAPWNINHSKINLINNKIFVDNYQLTLFHYQGLRFVSDTIIRSGLDPYQVNSTKLIREYIFKPIIENLLKFGQTIDNIPRGVKGTAVKGREYYKYINGSLKKLTGAYYLKIFKDRIKQILKYK